MRNLGYAGPEPTTETTTTVFMASSLSVVSSIISNVAKRIIDTLETG
jgi:hypothetical protein